MIISNISFPGTSNFIGELLVLSIIIVNINIWLSIIFIIGLFICSIYSMWLYNKIMFGLPKYNIMLYLKDINLLEFFILIPITIMITFIGFYPNWIIDLVYSNTAQYYMFEL